jgi:hypothetical protein
LDGRILVGIQNGYELNELHDVAISSPAAKQVIKRNAGNTLWVNEAIVSADVSDATSDATANTLVRRDGSGSAVFFELYSNAAFIGDLNVSGGIQADGPITAEAAVTYGTGAASAHRIALGAGTTGAELFGAATAAAARTTLEINRTRVTQAANLSNATTTLVDTDLVLTLQGGVDYLIRGMFDLESSAAGTGFQLRLVASQNIDIPAASGGIIGWVASFTGVSGASTTTLQSSTFLSQTLSGTRRVQAEFRLRLVATGTVKVTFAQNAGNIAPASVFKAGSFLTAEIL